MHGFKEASSGTQQDRTTTASKRGTSQTAAKDGAPVYPREATVVTLPQCLALQGSCSSWKRRVLVPAELPSHLPHSFPSG